MPPDPADVLLRKAQDDERLAILIADNPAITDEQVGFLAQQAIEKAVKAVLSDIGIRYRRTHDLGELLDLLKKSGVAHPAAMEASVGLTPFAAEMRYDYLPPEEPEEAPFDRPAALQLVRITLAWAKEVIVGPS